jgi:peptide/nickel transport system substrate-binding protein
MIVDRTTKLRFRRLLRRKQRQVEDLGVHAEEQLEQHVFKRINRFASVRRFVISWVLLVVLLIGSAGYQVLGLGRYYQTLQPVPGGTYTEGILGNFTNANPLYATGPVDAAVSRLLFAGLFKYDQQNRLVGDLAENWMVDEKGTTYTVTLRQNLVWHDGHPLTSQDVVFTYDEIQNADAKSPLFSSWQGVKVRAVDARTVTFALPSVLASFPHSMTNGLIPKHILSSIPASQLRSIRFDTVDPIGSGPFKMEALQVTGDTPETRQEQIALKPNESYYAGAPKLQRLMIRSFLDEKSMIASFQRQELTGMSGLNEYPDVLDDTSVQDYSVPITGEVGVFFRTTQGVLKDVKVRQALTRAVSQGAVIEKLGYPLIAARGPLLPGQIGYSKDILQLPYDVTAANQLLDAAGWKRGNDGTRVKGADKLAIRLVAQSTSEYTTVTQVLQSAWKAVGAKVDVVLQDDTEFQNTVSDRRYDALLYGISIGSDPDVFAYWHSSQADALAASRLNLSEYKSVAADRALEGGRTRLEPALRATKYRPFLEAWRNDAPAVMLYQPRYIYVTHSKVYGLEPVSVHDATARYANVHNWMIKAARVSN